VGWRRKCVCRRDSKLAPESSSEDDSSDECHNVVGKSRFVAT
jgi:hypothetical protein